MRRFLVIAIPIVTQFKLMQFATPHLITIFINFDTSCTIPSIIDSICIKNSQWNLTNSIGHA